MIDLHTHVLPSLDDGVRSLEEALELAGAAAAEGVTAIAATPHVRDDYPTRAERMESAIESLRDEFAGAGLAIELVAGGEVALQRLWQLSPDELRRFTYAGRGRWLLVEFPYRGWPDLLEQTQAVLARDGIGTVLAHPERNDAVQKDPRRLLPLVRAGVLIQITAGSLTGLLGNGPREAALRLLDLRAAHVLASDAHGPQLSGRSRLTDALAALGDEELGAYLTRAVPAAVLSGDEIPLPA